MDKDHTETKLRADSTPLNAQFSEPKLDHAEYWSGQHLGLHFKIVHWGIDVQHYQGHGNWNYYVYLSERNTPNFEEMWLPDKVQKFSPESHGFVSQDYYGLSANGADWHGGITYYAKLGHMVGYRAIELGCDYAHLFDSERGYDYTLNEVLYDCLGTIKQLVEILDIKSESSRGSEASVKQTPSDNGRNPNPEVPAQEKGKEQ